MKRCVFVSGGAKGIGRACVELFAARGWQVAFMDVDADAGRELAGSLAPLPVIFLRGSTCSRQDVESAIAEAAATFGGLGCVVANAGIHRSDTILDVSPEQLRQVVDTNIFGTINTMQAALPAIIASGAAAPLSWPPTRAPWAKPTVSPTASQKARWGRWHARRLSTWRRTA